METAEIKLRKATAEDLKTDNTNLKLGVCFWLKSSITGKFDNKPNIINKDTDPFQLKVWLDKKMIYIPVSDIWLEDYQDNI